MPVNSGWKNTFMKAIINCDMGEGMDNDALLMPFIDAANIACGWHAGDENTIRTTLELCIRHQVAIGAHPSFHDKQHFGRREMELPVQELYELIIQQLMVMNEFAVSAGGVLQHVKPHGALYNLSAKDTLTATIIAKAVKDFDKNLVLYGLSGSCSITEAEKAGLKTASEVFADRMYAEDGSLLPRSQKNAMISDTDTAVRQVLEMVNEGTVTAITGKKIPVKADTVCIHGDGHHALDFAEAIFAALHNPA